MMRRVFAICLFTTSIGLYAQEVDTIDAKFYDNDFSAALALIDDALQKADDPSEHFKLSLRKADASTRLGKYTEAEEILKRISAKIQNEKHAGMYHTTYGFLHLSKGRNDLASESLQKAIESFERINALGSLEAAQTQTYLGNLFVTTGQYAQAEEQLSVALLTRQRLLPSQHELIAASLNDLGLMFSFFDGDRALAHYEKALAIYEQLHGEKHAKIAIANTNIGYLYLKLELYGDAIVNFENALSIWQDIYPMAHPTKGFIYFSLGQTYEKMDNVKSAREYYDKAEGIYRETYSGKHPDIARVYNAIGNLEQREGKFESALRHYQEAIVANHPTFNRSGAGNPGVKEYYDGTVLLYSMLNKAQAWEQRYFRKSLKFDELLQAIRTLQSCDTLIAHLREQIRNESDKITLGGIAAEVYADGVRISMEASAAAWSKKKYLEQAFYFAEKSKSAVLLGAISEANAKSFAGIPQDLLDEERELKSSIALVSQRLATKPQPGEEAYLRSALYELNRTYESFGKTLETEYPSYFNLKYNTLAPSVKQLRAKLPGTTAILSYFIDERHKRLYIFKVLHSGLKVDEVALPEKFDRNITGLRNSLVFSDLEVYKGCAHGLSKVLLPDLPSSINDLVIIPTARLSVIPFESLLIDEPRKEQNFQSLPYLVRKYSIRYEFSSGLILQKSTAKERQTPSILLCAPVNFARTRFSDLPGTETEVKEISSLFKAKNYHANVLLRENADERTIKKEDLSRYTLLHFATHGVVDEGNPELSRVQLSEASAGEDGSLYSGEIYNLDLNADLVVLSACETGLGKISKGEGVIGLSRALVYAGARNCMVSFWKVADESTALLMKDYYALLLNQPAANYSATLRQAKLNLLSNEQYASPYYWAPFIHIGF